MRRELLNLLIGSLLTALFLQIGVLSETNNFFNNVIGAVLVYAVTRLLSAVLGGGR